MKWLAAALLTALLLLQYRLWFSNDGVRDVLRMRAEVTAQQQQNASLAERNRQLAGEVRDLKQGYAALEEHARADLGMIAGNETFYQVVPPANSAGSAGSAPAPGDGEAPEPAAPDAPAGTAAAASMTPAAATPAATALLGDAAAARGR